MTLRTLDDLGEVDGARVFVRVDLNVPLRDGAISDDSRIGATFPTLQELLNRGARLVCASHLGRPNGRARDDLRMASVGERLAQLMDRDVAIVKDPAPDQGDLPTADVILLENLRFDPGEEADDPAFAGRLAELADAYVDDAFGAVHRRHASVSALPELLLASGRRAVAGRLLEREVRVLSLLLSDPARPYVAILGGAKVSDKLSVIDALLERVEALLIGGAMAFTLIAARGGTVGTSLVEPDRYDDVLASLEKAERLGVRMLLPTDVVAAGAMDASAAATTVAADSVPNDLMGLDIGPDTVRAFSEVIAGAKTVLWNGPMGVFEMEPFARGTNDVARAVAESAAFTVVGGGDSVSAVKQAGLEDRFDHLSTGGGASLEFLEGRSLPGITILED
ncbi:MAG: phosphoglycerate kinase [Actinomycetota bacterium]|nr:phosphoglycerate kinase [Actinomycetota bacterium]